MIHLSPKGQNLIEITIVMAAIGVVLGALIIVVLTGLKNSQYAQNQSKATKYAQEAIDQIRAIRDQDGVIIFHNSSCTSNSYKFSDLWNFDLSSANPACIAGVLSNPSICAFTTTPTNPCAQNICSFKISQSGGLSLEEWGPEVINQEIGLTRQIIIGEDSPPAICKSKKITVRVTWKDTKGDHESNLQTILTPR